MKYFEISVELILNPKELTEIPLKSYFSYALEDQQDFVKNQ